MNYHYFVEYEVILFDACVRSSPGQINQSGVVRYFFVVCFSNRAFFITYSPLYNIAILWIRCLQTKSVKLKRKIEDFEVSGLILLHLSKILGDYRNISFVMKTSRIIRNQIFNVIFYPNTILLVRCIQLEVKQKRQWPSWFENLNNRHLSLITGYYSN